MTDFRLTVPLTGQTEPDESGEESMDYLGVPITITQKRAAVFPMPVDGETVYVDRGYIEGTIEVDDDEGMPCFVGPDEMVETAYLVPLRGDEDTFKRYVVLFGFESADCARKFAKGSVLGWSGQRDDIEAISLDDLLEWIEVEGFAVAKEERLDALEEDMEGEPDLKDLKELEPDLYEVVDDDAAFDE